MAFEAGNHSYAQLGALAQRMYDRLRILEAERSRIVAKLQAPARQRALHSRAKRVEPDSAGRIGLTADMRASANLEKDVVIVGNGNHIEIWSEKAWDEFINNVDLDGMYS